MSTTTDREGHIAALRRVAQQYYSDPDVVAATAAAIAALTPVQPVAAPSLLAGVVMPSEEGRG